MLAPLGRPSPARKKYEQVLLLPRKQLQHIDLSPPKAKSTQLTESSNGQGPTSKRKTLSDEENNAIWRRWKAAKDAEMRRRRQANAPLSDQELTPLVEQTAEESRKAVAAEGASFVTYVWMAMVDAQFLKWKKTKDDERRRERQRKRDLEAAWEREKECHLQALHEKLPPAMPSHQPTPPRRIDPMRLQQVQQKVLASPYAAPSRQRPHGCSTLPQLTKLSMLTRPISSNARGPTQRPPTEASTVFIEAPAVDIEPTFEAQHFPTVQLATASGKARSKPNETKLPPLLSALSMVEMPECSDRDSKREFEDDVEKPPNVQSKNVSADRVVRDGADYFDQVDAIAEDAVTLPPPPSYRDMPSRGATSGYGSELWDG
ncbi:hypothetical protein H310_11073 [Aphanomyces invadans]|uniref:Uncharacterized protein n=1 Tax=Aphanomyces invadans TaxID=157072 RepID=A0A024TNR7_9STRA|nr:hypothetical protein H310_11073 [Aphanomyces invadans]ETV95654.1 hypothetical protein H310_11073 [Aphanomyces invadans]|eukprot:XP_008875847.1 hypothetical protein H310_11073 [Aphanomyces invadans]